MILTDSYSWKLWLRAAITIHTIEPHMTPYRFQHKIMLHRLFSEVVLKTQKIKTNPSGLLEESYVTLECTHIDYVTAN